MLTTTKNMWLRVSVVLALLVSVCTGWAMSGGMIGRVATDLFRAAMGVNREEHPTTRQCRAVPAWDANLAEMQEAVGSFEAREYVPPVWARNAHLHTIVASGDMEKKILGDRAPLAYWRERWPTPDGDFVDIDWLPAEEPDDKRESPPSVNGHDSSSSSPDKTEAKEGGEEDVYCHHHQESDNSHIQPDVEPEGRPQASSAMVDDLHNEAEAMEVLRVATAFAQRAHGAGLGIGHLEAPEMVHKEHASWMKARMEDRQNWSSIDAGEGVGPEDGGKGRAQREPRRLVVLLHGLEGSSTAPLTKRFSSVYSRNGFDVAAVNFRGCSGEMGKYPIGYHLGFTDDLLHVIEEIHRRFPDTWDRLYLSGFSLGGNVIVKFLGEQGDRARELGIYGAAVGCVPFEPQLGAEKLEKDPVGRYLYMPVFLAWLNIKATEHARAYPEVLNLEDVQNLKTFLQFDSKVTLPVFGFETAEEYYQYVNAANYLSKVRVPLMVVNAKDDPFIDADSLPKQERAEDAPVRLVYHDCGGHCGFMNGLLSTVWKKSKTYNFARKWSLPWGRGDWTPWGDGNGAPAAAATAAAAAAAAGELEREVAETRGVVGAASCAVAGAAATTPTTATHITHSIWRQDNAGNLDVTDVGGSEQQAVGEESGVGGGGEGEDGSSLVTGSGKVLREGRWLPTEMARFIEHVDSSLHANGRSQQQQQQRERTRQTQQNRWHFISRPSTENECVPAAARNVA